jgi:hypothetical protein
MLPDGGESYRLANIVVHFKEEDLAATTLTAFSEFQFNLCVGDRPATRSAPRLAEYIALAPSVSLIAGDASTAPHFAFGFGINLARAFHFGYAWAPDSSSDYVLIGVAIPELLPLLKGFGGGPGAH